MSAILITTLFYKTLILQGEIWCWSLLGLKGLNTSISLQMHKFLFVPGHQQHCRCYSRRVPQLQQCLLQGQSHKDSFPSTDYELPPPRLTSSSPTKNSKTILTYGSRLRKFGETEEYQENKSPAIIGLFIRGTIRRVLNKMQTISYKRHIKTRLR